MSHPAFQPLEFSFNFSGVLVDLDSNPATPPVTLGSLGSAPNMGLSEDFDGNISGSRPNPFLHFRFTALVSPPGQPTVVYPIPGFFAGAGGTGNPCTGDVKPGCVWKFRFAPDERAGIWTFTVVLDAGDGLNFGYATYGSPGAYDLVTNLDGRRDDPS
ncbi:MAG: hypothetical protein R3F49_23255 [Planctomycetota bacterium]